MTPRIYFDHNATTPLCPAARSAMQLLIEDGATFGNPSSIHAEGRAARELVERARRQVAASMGAAADDLVFTSGGTESDCLGIIGLARLARERGASPRVVTSGLEHPAVLGAVDELAQRGFAVQRVEVSGDGTISAEAVAAACAGGAALVTLQLANHELGTLQDVGMLAEVARSVGALVHCDAVQALGKVELRVDALGVDALAVSAHKIGGPKGVGALWLARAHHELGAIISAGHQERGRRPGTENLVGVVGFGAAAEAAPTRVEDLTAALEAGLARIDGARIHGADARRVGNTTSVSFDGVAGEVVVCSLDLEGVAVSTGAACTSGSVAPSPVLLAIGLGAGPAAGAVRFSLGATNTLAEVKVVLELLPGIVARARAFS
jgi:cysteine desulfurase